MRGAAKWRDGLEVFCEIFLSHLATIDTSNSVINAFRPRRRGSRNISRTLLLGSVVRFLLSIDSESRGVKQKLRALGRAHARINIWQSEFDLFCAAFLETLLFFPAARATSEVFEAWASLLRFAIDQMCFDRINFKDHCTLQGAAVVSVVDVDGGDDDSRLFGDSSTLQTQSKSGDLTSRGLGFGSLSGCSGDGGSINVGLELAAGDGGDGCNEVVIHNSNGNSNNNSNHRDKSKKNPDVDKLIDFD